MVVEKYYNDYGLFDIIIKDTDKVLSVSLRGDDHDISCNYDSFEKISEISFDILKEEEELYPIFEKLYNNIVSGNLLNGDLNDSNTLAYMESQRNYSWYSDIVDNDGITIISDATPVTCPNILKIIKELDRIKLVFTQEDGKKIGIPKNPFRINIHVRQSGSKLYDFCIPFKNLYKDLQNVTEKNINDVNKLKILKSCK